MKYKKKNIETVCHLMDLTRKWRVKVSWLWALFGLREFLRLWRFPDYEEFSNGKSFELPLTVLDHWNICFGSLEYQYQIIEILVLDHWNIYFISLKYLSLDVPDWYPRIPVNQGQKGWGCAGRHGTAWVCVRCEYTVAWGWVDVFGCTKTRGCEVG